ncbi:MAG: hypothetical protein ACI9MC_003487, partial [Kiritimatiellia bacterium]
MTPDDWAQGAAPDMWPESYRSRWIGLGGSRALKVRRRRSSVTGYADSDLDRLCVGPIPGA